MWGSSLCGGTHQNKHEVVVVGRAWIDRVLGLEVVVGGGRRTR